MHCCPFVINLSMIANSWQSTYHEHRKYLCWPFGLVPNISNSWHNCWYCYPDRTSARATVPHASISSVFLLLHESLLLTLISQTLLGLGRGRLITWWRHQMETFSALLDLCAGNSPVPGEFPSQRPVTRSFDAFFDLRHIYSNNLFNLLICYIVFEFVLICNATLENIMKVKVITARVIMKK